MGAARVKHRVSLAQWINGATDLLRSGEEAFQEIDLDQVLGASYRPPWDIGLAIELYLGARDALMAEPWVVALAISLKSSPRLVAAAPDISQLTADLNEFNPPGLYLLSPQMFLRPWPFEEYRVPLEPLPPLDPPPKVNLRYSCFRSPPARREGWDWDRVIWLEYWPEVTVALDRAR
jgi:hypothetical protein